MATSSDENRRPALTVLFRRALLSKASQAMVSGGAVIAIVGAG
jgi:hypothetical protein